MGLLHNNIKLNVATNIVALVVHSVGHFAIIVDSTTSSSLPTDIHADKGCFLEIDLQLCVR